MFEILRNTIEFGWSAQWTCLEHHQNRSCEECSSQQENISSLRPRHCWSLLLPDFESAFAKWLMHWKVSSSAIGKKRCDSTIAAKRHSICTLHIIKTIVWARPGILIVLSICVYRYLYPYRFVTFLITGCTQHTISGHISWWHVH